MFADMSAELLGGTSQCLITDTALCLECLNTGFTASHSAAMQALISKSTAYATPGCKVSTSSRVAVPSCNPPAVQRLPVQVSHGSRRTLVAVHAQASGSSQTQEARWENQVRDGTVKNCTTKQAGKLGQGNV